jgi:hypothetical protein
MPVLAHPGEPGEAGLLDDRARDARRQQLGLGVEGEDLRVALEGVEHRGDGALRPVEALEPVVHQSGAHREALRRRALAYRLAGGARRRAHPCSAPTGWCSV